MPLDLQAKQEQLARLIDGEVVDSQGRVAVCVKGEINGFRATLEAIAPGWPFGVNYFVESTPGVDPASKPTRPAAKLTICPRIGRGVGALFTNLLLFEARSTRIDDKELENVFNFTFDNREIAEAFLHSEGVREILFELDQTVNFSEAVVRTDAGVYLSQPKAFNGLDLDQAKQVFQLLGGIAEILANNF